MQVNGRVVLGENVGAGNGVAQRWLGGKGIFMATATWSAGSAKLQIQMSDTNGTWVDLKSPAGNAVSLTADGTAYFEAPAGQIRVVVATSTGVYAYAVGVHQ